MAWGPRPGTAASSPRWKESTSRPTNPCRQLRSSSRQCPAFTQFLYSVQLRRAASSDNTMSHARAVKGMRAGGGGGAGSWRRAAAAARTRGILGSFHSASVGEASTQRRRSSTQKPPPRLASSLVTEARGGPFFHVREAAAPQLKGTA